MNALLNSDNKNRDAFYWEIIKQGDVQQGLLYFISLTSSMHNLMLRNTNKICLPKIKNIAQNKK